MEENSNYYKIGHNEYNITYVKGMRQGYAQSRNKIQQWHSYFYFINNRLEGEDLFDDQLLGPDER